MDAHAGGRPTVVITAKVFPETKAVLRHRCDLVCNDDPDRVWDRGKLIERARNATAILAFMPDSIDARLLAACPKLQVIACALKGYDNFDVASCDARGVWLTIVSDLLTEPTAELTVGLMIAAGRRILAADAHVRAKAFASWRPTFYGTGLAGATVGIVGFGAVGQAVACRLAGFRARILFADPLAVAPAVQTELGAQPRRLPDLLAESDFVVLAVPLVRETKHLIDAEAIHRMRPGAHLINTARGSVVDEAAVAAALRRGRLASYAADVFEMEDWAREDRPREIHPDLLRDGASTVLTPHIGSATEDARRAIELEAAYNILDVLDGCRPRGAVNHPGDSGRRLA